MFFKYLTIMTILIVSGCASKPEPSILHIPAPAPFIGIKDPNNQVLMSAIEEYIALRKGPKFSRFEYSRIDLNNDSRKDAIVMFKSPSSFWCHDHGCRTIIFKANNDNFGLLTEINKVRGPLHINYSTTNGWRDIILREDGRGARARHVALKFNGISYPSNSQYEMTYFDLTKLNGTRILP